MNDRIQDTDELITLDETRALMGGMSVATAYVDADLMALKVSMTAGGRRTKSVRFIKREVLALRAERVARADVDVTSIRAEIAARVERRREKQRARKAAEAA